MFDLIVQAAESEVREPVSAHIARGEHLAAQIVGVVGGAQA
jgi:hypothetical protein